MHKVACRGYMERHKKEILKLIKKGLQIKQIAESLGVSSTTLSNYIYYWKNGRKKQEGNYISSIKLVEPLPIMERISSETRAKSNYNTVRYGPLRKKAAYPRNFFSDSLINKLLDSKFGK